MSDRQHLVDSLRFTLGVANVKCQLIRDGSIRLHQVRKLAPELSRMPSWHDDLPWGDVPESQLTRP